MHLRDDFPDGRRRALAAPHHPAPAAPGARRGPERSDSGERSYQTAAREAARPRAGRGPRRLRRHHRLGLRGPRRRARRRPRGRRALAARPPSRRRRELVDPALRVETLVGDGAALRRRRHRRTAQRPPGRDPGRRAHRPQLPLPALAASRRSRRATSRRRPARGARIAATRKTTPGLRALEKEAVVHGGGTPHRFGLFDGAMIKDNHVAAAGGVRGGGGPRARRRRAPARRSRSRWTRSSSSTRRSPPAPAIVLLDNMDTRTVRAAVRAGRRARPGRGLGRRAARARARAGRGRRRHHLRRARSPRGRRGSTSRSTWRSDGAARRRRRQHADADRPHRRRRRGRRRLAHRHRAAPDQRRDRRPAAGLLLAARHAPARRVDEVGIASVVPRLTQQWVEMCEKHLGVERVRGGPRGADRHAHRHEEPGRGRRRPHRQCGGRLRDATAGPASSPTSARPPPSTWSPPTATTWAAPSPPASKSPWRRSRRAPPSSSRSTLVEPEHAIGKSTIEALQAGAVYGFAGEVEGIVHAIWERARRAGPGHRHRRPGRR